MFIIRLCGLSVTSAEDLVAEIWCALEEHDIATPAMSVKSNAGGTLDVQFTFNTKQEADRITRAVPELAPTVCSKTMLLHAEAGWTN
jgi:hypothetical protein